MDYYAHISDDGRRQTVAEHCRKAASYAAECLSSVGLFDCIDENHASGFLHRLQSHDSEYQEAIKNAEVHLITHNETNQLFQASCEEMSIIFEKIQKILDFESSQENDLQKPCAGGLHLRAATLRADHPSQHHGFHSRR